MSETNSGITYYGLTSEYEGDVTKNCGLTASEIDSNFYFLRGNEVVGLDWDDEENLFIIRKLNGEEVKSDSVTAYIDRTIEEILSGITEDIEALKCEVSGISESVAGVYDEIDARMEDVREDLGKLRRMLEHEMDEKDEAIILEFNTKINGLAQSLSLLSDTVSSNTERIEALENGVTAAVMEVKEELEGEIRSNTRSIENLSATTRQDIETVYTTLGGRIDDHDCEISALREADSAMTDHIESVESDVTELSRITDSRISQLSERIDSNTDMIGSLSAGTNNALESVREGVAVNKSAINDLSANTESAVSGLSERTDGMEGSIESLSAGTIASISEINSELRDINDRIDELSGNTESSISGLSRELVETNRNVSDLSASTSEAIEEIERNIDGNINERLNDLSATTSSGFDEVNAKVSANTMNIDALSAFTYSESERLSERISMVDRKVDQNTSSIDGLRESDQAINARIDGNVSEIGELRESDEAINTRIDDVDAYLSAVTQDIQDIRSEIGDPGSMSGETITEYINTVVNENITVIKTDISGIEERLRISGNDVEA